MARESQADLPCAHQKHPTATSPKLLNMRERERRFNHQVRNGPKGCSIILPRFTSWRSDHQRLWWQDSRTWKAALRRQPWRRAPLLWPWNVQSALSRSDSWTETRNTCAVFLKKTTWVGRDLTNALYGARADCDILPLCHHISRLCGHACLLVHRGSSSLGGTLVCRSVGR